MAKKRKKPKGPHSKFWRTKADKLWSQAINTLYRGQCAICGKPGNHPHHLIGRAVPFTRHALMNGMLLCAPHHVWEPFMCAHGGVLFTPWLQESHPIHYNYVVRNKHRLKMPYDYEEAFHKLEDFLKLSKLQMDERLESLKELYQPDKESS